MNENASPEGWTLKEVMGQEMGILLGSIHSVVKQGCGGLANAFLVRGG